MTGILAEGGTVHSSWLDSQVTYQRGGLLVLIEQLLDHVVEGDLRPPPGPFLHGGLDGQDPLVQIGVELKFDGADSESGGHDGSPVKGRVSVATAAAISGSTSEAARRSAQADSSAHSHCGPGCRVTAGSVML